MSEDKDLWVPEETAECIKNMFKRGTPTGQAEGTECGDREMSEDKESESPHKQQNEFKICLSGRLPQGRQMGLELNSYF